jgi:hypothetical protein
MKSLLERTNVQQAYLEGKKIQVDMGYKGEWADWGSVITDKAYCEPVFDWVNFDYRVKKAGLYKALFYDDDGVYIESSRFFETEDEAKHLFGNKFVRLMKEYVPIYV